MENKIMNNEELKETGEKLICEVIPDTTASNKEKLIGAVIGSAITVAGGLVCEYVLIPGAKKVSEWGKNRKAKKNVTILDDDPDEVAEGEFNEVNEDPEE